VFSVIHSGVDIDDDDSSSSQELVGLFFDEAILTNLFFPRISCKVNNDIRRFPIYYATYRELEANLIEGFIACNACRFVSTTIINTVY
jgi:hypothetical protein